MKQLSALQHQARRSNSFRNASSPPDAASIKSPATIFCLVIHGLCCLISLVIGYRFSRLVFFLLFSPAAFHTPSPSAASVGGGGSRVMVGRHGILIRPWPHPDPVEIVKAHEIIERVQLEQRSQFGGRSPKSVIAITPTYVRTFQAMHLTGLMHTLMNVPNLIWIVVEAGGTTNETASLISKSGLKTIHIAPCS